ncbi:hypothetical protein NHX12_025316 [Muraenolepis orangiensis]|uniref:Uncharacterized protein n=1 Tax=Muraenolepis orangiensis TaxID=630683 RepID=A0A9Q0EPL7_9TELE|nr:hypothetical protein NHX12_025316 [Muraenolepis orangiensis]
MSASCGPPAGLGRKDERQPSLLAPTGGQGYGYRLPGRLAPRSSLLGPPPQPSVFLLSPRSSSSALGPPPQPSPPRIASARLSPFLLFPRRAAHPTCGRWHLSASPVTPTRHRRDTYDTPTIHRRYTDDSPQRQRSDDGSRKSTRKTHNYGPLDCEVTGV